MAGALEECLETGIDNTGDLDIGVEKALDQYKAMKEEV